MTPVRWFRLQSKQYAPWIVNYISSRFDKDDIRAISLEDVILCFDLCIPSSAKSVEKSYSLRERVGTILVPFEQDEKKEFNDNNGISAQEKAEIDEAAIIGAHKLEEQRASSYGGTVRNSKRKNIKKKNRE